MQRLWRTWRSWAPYGGDACLLASLWRWAVLARRYLAPRLGPYSGPRSRSGGARTGPEATLSGPGGSGRDLDEIWTRSGGG